MRPTLMVLLAAVLAASCGAGKTPTAQTSPTPPAQPSPAPAPPPPPSRYTVNELPSAAGQVIAMAMSAAGDVAGYVIPDGGDAHPFLRRAGADLTLLPPTDRPAYAVAVNAAGTVILHDADHAVYRYQDGQLTPLDTGGPAVPTAIDSAGTVVGFSLASADELGFVTSPTGITRLTGLPASPGSSPALAIDDAGQVVGASGGRAVRFEGAVAKELPVPPSATALGLSGTGLVVGACRGAGKTSQGYVLDLATQTVTTVDPPEGFYSLGFSFVDAAGTAFGTALNRNGRTHVMRWTAGKLVDVHDLVADPGFDFEYVTAQIPDGRLLVWGHGPDGRVRSAVLVPQAQ